MRKLLLLLMCAAAMPAAAQDPAPQAPAAPIQGPTFRTGIDLIAVDVAVVDRDGRPVEDLRAPEFSVRVDGEERRVVSAELVKVDVEAARRRAEDKTESFFTSNLTPPDARMVVIAVDQINIHPGAIKPLLSAASRFLDRLSPLDQVAFVAYPEPGPRVNFTTDRLKVRLAMEQLVGRTPDIPATTLNIGVSEAQAIEAKRDELVLATVVARECRNLTAQQRAQCERDIISLSYQIAQRVRNNADESMVGLRELLRRLSAVDGPKSLILISEGLAIEDPNELDTIVALAGRARVAINIMQVDLRRNDITIAEAPPTEQEDRRIQTRGLEMLATMSRGSLYYIVGTGDPIFERLASEISAYYLLGVEQRPGDEREQRRRIDVEVRRRDVTIRSRQAFVLSPAVDRRQSAEERLRDALGSPFGVSGVPLRVTTFAQQDPASRKVQLMVAAQVGTPGAAAGEYTVGWILVDDENKVAASYADRRTLAPAGAGATEPLAFVGGTTVEPGLYTLRFGVVDAEGRRGSIVRDVSAWKLTEETFAAGDLIVGDVPPAGDGLRPAVEPHITGDGLAAYIQLYSTTPATWDGATLTFEIADDEAGPAIASATGRLEAGSQPEWRIGSGVIGARALPAGRYVARARVTRGGETLGVLARPILIERPEGTSAIPPAVASAAAGVFAQALPRFDREAALAPDVVGAMLDLTLKRSPALADAIAEARAGRYGMAALEALTSGDQEAAAFLRGLDLFIKNDVEGAVTQLDLASGPRREFFPAAFYLGALFASAGRDRDAAGIWQLALGDAPRPAAVYLMVADARLRDGQPASAIDILEPVWTREPTDEVARRLGMAFVLTNRYAEAFPVLDAFLASHPDDQDALLAAIVSRYETAQAGQTLSNADRAKLKTWASAYRGPQTGLVDKYLTTLGVR